MVLIGPCSLIDQEQIYECSGEDVMSLEILECMARVQ